MKNLVLLCTFHHRLVHEGGFSIVERDRAWVFVDPRGKDVPALPRPLLLRRDAARALEQTGPRHVAATGPSGSAAAPLDGPSALRSA